MTTACIFNLQKFSLHDGPGIRTTVFFKGCPLRCLWCANPESLRPGVEILWNRDQCRACGACAAKCRAGAIILDGRDIKIDRQTCTGCGDCVAICPGGALTLSGREYELDEVVLECLSDRDFYEESGGGVTLSGGEVTAQASFALALLRRLRAEGIHTALETNGHARPEVFRELAGSSDLILFDVKHYEAARHLAGTGVENGLILDNLAWALANVSEILIRIPVIRGYSDRLDDARGFAQLLTGMGVGQVQLLPFHQFGQKKYDSLGMEYSFEGLRPLHREDLAEYREAMLAEGIREVIV